MPVNGVKFRTHDLSPDKAALPLSEALTSPRINVCNEGIPQFFDGRTNKILRAKFHFALCFGSCTNYDVQKLSLNYPE